MLIHSVFFTAESEQNLLGAVWALKEGGIEDSALIEAIQQGSRRPKGNLVPQALCFHSQLQKACELHSLRISRIAVQPMWRQLVLVDNSLNILHKIVIWIIYQ